MKTKTNKQKKARNPGVRTDSFKLKEGEVYFHRDRKEAKKEKENYTEGSLN